MAQTATTTACARLISHGGRLASEQFPSCSLVVQANGSSSSAPARSSIPSHTRPLRRQHRAFAAPPPSSPSPAWRRPGPNQSPPARRPPAPRASPAPSMCRLSMSKQSRSRSENTPWPMAAAPHPADWSTGRRRRRRLGLRRRPVRRQRGRPRDCLTLM